MQDLKKYAQTAVQLAALDAMERHNGHVATAASELGMFETNLRRMIRHLKARAAKFGHSPEHDMTRTVPEGFAVKGVSTYYNKDGVPSGQWVKSSIDRERQLELMRETIDALKSELPTAEPVALIEKARQDELLNLYVITDYHIGMYAWGEETGGDWDIKIAEDTLVRWFAAAIQTAPAAHTGVFCNLGDFAHWDGISAVTPTSGHVLDADTRFRMLVRIMIRVVRRVIGMLLDKHEHVHVLMAEGNHDLASSGWLSEIFAAYYEAEPRVTVDTRPDPYYCIEHGDTSLFFHHGHKKPFKALESVFVAKFREVYGRTKHSYAHTGHLHHEKSQETNTMTLRQHRTLAAPDSHASRGGWMSGRSARVETYSKRYGHVATNEISYQMLLESK